MSEKSIPSRGKKPSTEFVPPGSPFEDEEIAPPIEAAPVANPFAVPTKAAEKRSSLAGRYRVREGYQVAYGALQGDGAHSVGRHPQAKGGEVIDLTHEEAISVIRLTKDQRDPKTGRPNGPAIETEVSYNARITAETEHRRFMEEVAGVNSLDALTD